MITKIRNAVFETNSSSVHSLTIKSKNPENQKNGLVVDFVLYPDVFCQMYKRFLGAGDGYYIYENGKMWQAYTRDEKAATLFGYLNCAKLDESDACQTKTDACIGTARALLAHLYVDVVMGEESIPIFGDKGENPFDFGCLSTWSSSTVEDCQKIVQEFCKVIEDDNVFIEVVMGEG